MTPANPEKSVFIQSLPITFTSFVNKIGDIGLRVLPMLLVELHASPNQSSLVMSATKGAAILSTFVGGWLSDRTSGRNTITLSFCLSAIGMFCLASNNDLRLVALSAVMASFGQGLFASPLRVLLFATTEPGKRQEALAWLRTANNGAVMAASFVSYLLTGVGLAGLFIFDAISSLIASVVGFKILPGRVNHEKTGDQMADQMTDQMALSHNEEESSHKSSDSNYLKFMSLALLVALFTLLGELVFVSAAALARKEFGQEGIKLFSACFMVNTGLCMLLSVKVSRMVTNPTFSFTVGIMSQFSAFIFLLMFRTQPVYYFVAILIQTMGEIIFSSMSQYSLMKLLPNKSRQGTVYSVALLLQQCGKMIAGALAFQLIAI